MVSATTYQYQFYGPYLESNTFELLTLADDSPANVTITVHYANQTEAFVMNGVLGEANYLYNTTIIPTYFSYDVTDNTTTPSTVMHREYWLDADETGGTQWVLLSHDLVTTSFYIFNFNNIRAFDAGAFLVARIVTGFPESHIVERRVIDNLGDIALELLPNTDYELSIEAVSGSAYSFSRINTVTTVITLNAPSSAFPEATLLMYPYVTFYGYRTCASPYGSIVIQYNDSKAQTNSFTATITDPLGNIAYTYTVAATDTVNLIWNSAVNSTIYSVTVSVDHGLYGDVSWKQTFPNQAGDSPSLFSFSFLGNWAFDTKYIFPALIILFIACCFSVLNAEVGAVLATIAGIVLAYMGWLPIPAGALISAFSLAILMALVYNKRRMAGY